MLSAQLSCPIKSLALSAHVSPGTIQIQVLDESNSQALEGVSLSEITTKNQVYSRMLLNKLGHLINLVRTFVLGILFDR